LPVWSNAKRILQAESDDAQTSFNIDINDFMTFELVRGANSAPEKKLRYTPKLGDFSGDGLKIEFDFENPLYVSAGDEPDKIVAQFTDPRLLLDPNTGMFI